MFDQRYQFSIRVLAFAALSFLIFLNWSFLHSESSRAAPKLPELTGRVMDLAQVLSQDQEKEIAALSKSLEAHSTDQIVVVTLPSLQGYPIEDFGIELARKWGIGQAGKDNGVVLIVAPVERKIRIEVGRGLEGVLPDALAGLIIQRRILPLFKKGDLAGGIKVGVEDIRTSLLGDSAEVAQRAKKREKNDVSHLLFFVFLAFWLVPFIYFVSSLNRDRRISGRVPGGVVIVPGSFGRAEDHWTGPGGFRRSPGGFGGGFSGGGGSFGGGGASGNW